ncbi:MAG: hypothetical protein H6766_03265 [Candidatus Peribacteria bacterium]|nr:MAG: hypothetical protein H6766_03265 [Candidatus Peribacteria bacterium]
MDMANKKKTEEAKMLFGKEYVLKGTDRDLQMIAHAKANADRAGVSDLVSRERKALGERAHRDGMIVSNPPYGKRLLPQTGEKLGSVDEMDQMDMEVFYEDLITLLEQEGTNG